MCMGGPSSPTTPPPPPPPPPPVATAERVQPAQASKRAGTQTKRKRGTAQLTRPSIGRGAMSGAGVRLPL